MWEKILTYNENLPLLFTQFYFWIFFGLVMLIYSILYKHRAIRNAYLFGVSLLFYYETGGYFFWLLIFSTIVDYFIGLQIFRSKPKWKKKLFVAASVTVNLGVLSYFKYAYFYTEMLNRIFGTNIEVVNLLAQWSNELANTGFDVSSIILPVGISFYTFQTISYSVDLYRGKLDKPVRNIIDFGFYVSFFPQLVAGPIVRAAEFVPQLYQKYRLTLHEFGYAFFLILNGLIKKMLISDYISVNFVDRVFDMPNTFTGFENLMAVFGYGLQIYCDFSGYTDIAIGLALLMGFRLPVNFNSPYKATNLTDFWRRWHISLSSWLRDYLYISLGGNRKGKIRTYVNLMLTMLLGGLWHGAALRFIIWGGLHGVGLAVHKIWLFFFPPVKKQHFFLRIVPLTFTFLFVHFAWIFFRARDMDTISVMLKQIWYNFSWATIPAVLNAYTEIYLLILVGFVIHWLPSSLKKSYRELFIRSPLWVKIGLAVLTVFIVYQAKSAGVQPFIYFQF